MLHRKPTEYYLDFIATICKPCRRKQGTQDMSVVLAGVIKWPNTTTFSLNQRVLAGVTGNLVDKQQQRLVVPSRWSRLEMKPNKSHQERRYKIYVTFDQTYIEKKCINIYGSKLV